MATIPEALAVAVQHHQAGRFEAAEQIYRQILRIEPNQPDAIHLLGVMAHQVGKLELAIEYIGRAIALNGTEGIFHCNLGAVFRAQGKLDAAIACVRRALELQPDLAEAHSNLGDTLKDQGKLDEAIACYRRALELNPELIDAHSNLLYALNFCAGCDARAIYEDHRRWNQRFAEPLAELIQPHSNERSADRRLRIGYVSPDFREHSVGRFLLPLLESHGHERFEIYCYASVRIPDATTDRCRAHADVWRNVLGFSDDQLASVICHDRIDILVDLTMHLANNRLLVFARKPAPVQVTYLAYAGTTGLSTMDYRLTDPYLDPPGQYEPVYCEGSIRLPETYWCYRPVVPTPAVNALPALQTGHITFGCLNNFCKVTEPTLTAWGELLRAIPDSTLLLHALSGAHRVGVRDIFSQHGISPERLVFADWAPMAEYLQLYHRIDVALDPFPYCGGTTTCDAIWMGVPVVSLAGQTAVGRGGLSILSNLGLADFVAYDSEQYVRIALDLANDLARLSRLRATLRDRMQDSPLMDARRFARNVEAAYRAMWQRWCAT
jgi:predicted O-linked N-acetylglucosamine transferase (SPINDLY family)